MAENTVTGSKKADDATVEAKGPATEAGPNLKEGAKAATDTSGAKRKRKTAKEWLMETPEMTEEMAEREIRRWS